MPSAATNKLTALLRELFQLDQPDLDFGIYRVLHTRAAEIDRFLSTDLLARVAEAFAHYRPADAAAKRAELDRISGALREAGVEPDTNPKVLALRADLTAAVDVTSLENEVFDHLYAFFRRYYAEGDFLARRVYKPGVYAIPYEGEEVALHWANRDQYYIKTSEYLRDYAFRLRPTADPALGHDPLRVHFRLADAAEGEHGNVKTAEGKERVFVLRTHQPAAPAYALAAPAPGAPAELTFFFEYRPATLADWPAAARDGKTKPPAQRDLLAQAAQTLLALPDPALAPWLDKLRQPHRREDGTLTDRSRLDVHLDRYTKRNTFDYFIHKDLGGFLRRELDFFLKSEVLRLDDLGTDSAAADAPARVAQYLSKVRVVRQLGLHVIEFLAQLEDFQKRLWLKKKFVVSTQWCMTLDRVPADLLPAVATNAAQWAEWQALNFVEATATPPAPAAVAAFAAANPHLVVDTHHFEPDFTARLLAAQDGDLDDLTDGLLVHGENFQALNLLQARYAEGVDCVYIDPPYNTAASEILYKNEYKHSSWLTLMDNRLENSRHLMRDSGIICAAIDDFEGAFLYTLMEQIFGESNHLANVPIRTKPQGRAMAAGFSPNHDYVFFFGKTSKAEVGRLPRDENRMTRYSERDDNGFYTWANFRGTGANSTRRDRPKLFYPLFACNNTLRVPQLKWNDSAGELGEWEMLEQPTREESIVWPIDDNNEQRVWTLGAERAATELGELNVRHVGGRFQVYRKYRPNQDGSLPGTWWDDAKYSASENGTKVVQDIFGSTPFTYPKSIHAVVDCLRSANAHPTSLTIDYFGGSGTTGHAVINLNREDGGRRKFILVEMGNHFNTATLPRIKKVTFAPEWKDGRPKRPATPEERARSPRLLKVIRLESYEDTLNNLRVERATAVQGALFGGDEAAAPPAATAAARQQYVLRYLLDVETRGSRSLLDVEAFADPTAYTLLVKAPGTDESRPVQIDLIETFTYLLGLRVQEMGAPQTLTATFERDAEGRLGLAPDGLRPAKAGHTGPTWWLRAITGQLPTGQRALIIWRRLSGDPERDNLVLDAWFSKRAYNTRAHEFDVIYVNGDSNLDNLRQPDTDTWKVRLIEEAFHGLLFA